VWTAHVDGPSQSGRGRVDGRAGQRRVVHVRTELERRRGMAGRLGSHGRVRRVYAAHYHGRRVAQSGRTALHGGRVPGGRSGLDLHRRVAIHLSGRSRRDLAVGDGRPDGRAAVQNRRGRAVPGRGAVCRRDQRARCGGGRGRAAHRRRARLVFDRDVERGRRRGL